eukprot:5456088-Alexandrium_andersonii.AAC.1
MGMPSPLSLPLHSVRQPKLHCASSELLEARPSLQRGSRSPGTRLGCHGVGVDAKRVQGVARDEAHVAWHHDDGHAPCHRLGVCVHFDQLLLRALRAVQAVKDRRQAVEALLLEPLAPAALVALQGQDAGEEGAEDGRPVPGADDRAALDDVHQGLHGLHPHRGGRAATSRAHVEVREDDRAAAPDLSAVGEHSQRIQRLCEDGALGGKHVRELGLPAAAPADEAEGALQVLAAVEPLLDRALAEAPVVHVPPQRLQRLRLRRGALVEADGALLAMALAAERVDEVLRVLARLDLLEQRGLAHEHRELERGDRVAVRLTGGRLSRRRRSAEVDCAYLAYFAYLCRHPPGPHKGLL